MYEGVYLGRDPKRYMSSSDAVRSPTASGRGLSGITDGLPELCIGERPADALDPQRGRWNENTGAD
jgi:hypothetical protein